MAKKTKPYSPYGDFGVKLKKFFTSDGGEDLGIVRAGRGVGNAILSGGASVADAVGNEKDSTFGKVLRRAGEVAGAGVITGGASLAPQIIGGDTYQPQYTPKTKTPKGSTKRSKPAATRSVPTPTKRPTMTAATKTVATSRPKARGIQSWRSGGSDDYNPRYDPGTKPSVPKKPKSRADRGAHDFSGLKGFFK